jgi:hypothetical protein
MSSMGSRLREKRPPAADRVDGVESRGCFSPMGAARAMADLSRGRPE